MTRTTPSEWWNALSQEERETLTERAEKKPARVFVRFVPPEEMAEEELTLDLYEYLVNHELSFPDGRTFHICSAHAAARARVSAGHIPASFECPRADAACPMRALLSQAPGCDVRLHLEVQGS